MTVAIASIGFAISFLCALVMGYAIQRGATCTVAAVGQVFEQGRWGRFAGLMEAALWVAGGLLLARAFGFLPDLPSRLAGRWCLYQQGLRIWNGCEDRIARLGLSGDACRLSGRRMGGIQVVRANIICIA
jgi:hypothetical protein